MSSMMLFCQPLTLVRFYLCHSAVSLPIGVVSAAILRRRFETPLYQMALFVFVLNISLPIIGYVVTIWVVTYLMKVEYKQLLKSTTYIDMTEFEARFPMVNRVFGEASIERMMGSGSDINAELKMKALMSLAESGDRLGLRFIKRSLSDKNDEIRLYSFAIVDKKERAINEQIHLDLIRLDNASNDHERLDAAYSLMQSYWDMIYFELSDSDLKKFILEKIENYAKMVLDIEPEHMACRTILGKMYLSQNDLENAEREFLRVIQSGKDNDYIVPYLAETYYLMRRFDKLREYLCQAKRIRQNKLLYPIKRLWCKI